MEMVDVSSNVQSGKSKITPDTPDQEQLKSKMDTSDLDVRLQNLVDRYVNKSEPKEKPDNSDEQKSHEQRLREELVSFFSVFDMESYQQQNIESSLGKQEGNIFGENMNIQPENEQEAMIVDNEASEEVNETNVKGNEKDNVSEPVSTQQIEPMHVLDAKDITSKNSLESPANVFNQVKNTTLTDNDQQVKFAQEDSDEIADAVEELIGEEKFDQQCMVKQDSGEENLSNEPSLESRVKSPPDSCTPTLTEADPNQEVIQQESMLTDKEDNKSELQL